MGEKWYLAINNHSFDADIPDEGHLRGFAFPQRLIAVPVLVLESFLFFCQLVLEPGQKLLATLQFGQLLLIPALEYPDVDLRCA